MSSVHILTNYISITSILYRTFVYPMCLASKAHDITVAGFLVTVEFVELYCINYSMCRI